MNLRKNFHTFDSLYTFLLLLVFLLFSLLLAGTGSAVYQKGADSLEENYTSRTALSYLTEKLRQHDSSGELFFSKVDTLPALTLRDRQGDDRFLTYIYYYEGALRELFTREGNTVTPDMGSAIVGISGFDFALVGSDGILRDEINRPEDPADRTLLLRLSVTNARGEEQWTLVHLSAVR